MKVRDDRDSIDDDRDSIDETDWITTHQRPTRSERERADPHIILRQATKDGKGQVPSPKERSHLLNNRGI